MTYRSVSSRNLLIVSYHYPPDLAVGALRAAMFARHLPSFGWNVSLLTVFKQYYEDVGTITQHSEAITIYRTGKLPTFRDIYLRLRRFIFRCSNIKQSSAQWTPPNEKRHETALKRVQRYFESLTTWLPDDKAGWIIPSVIAGMNIIKKNNIGAVLTTSPPNSVHLIGLLLKLITNKPWIVDFRDPWQVEMKHWFVRSQLSDYIENWLINKVIAKADRIVTVTPELTKRLLVSERIPFNKKVYTIYNGYDSDELRQYASVQKHKMFTITYAGTFYLGRDPEIMLSALSSLIKNGAIQKDKIRIQFIGHCRYLYNKSIEQIVKKLELDNVVAFLDILPRNEALKEMAKSHVLLILAPDQPLQIPRKLFEYMGLGASILAVCNSGATMNALGYYPNKEIVLPGDEYGMQKSLLRLYHGQQKKPRQNAAKNWKNEFEAKLLTKRLTKILETLAEYVNENKTRI